MKATLKRKAVPLLILAAGLGGAFLLAAAREAPVRRPRRVAAPLVAVQPVARTNVTLTVEGYGTVQPLKKVEVIPQVGGQVVALAGELAAGTPFRRGDLLVRIDPRDYRLQEERAAAEVTRAEVALETAEADAELARREWDELHPGQAPPNRLVVRAAQLDRARADLAAAEAARAAAALAVERTEIRAPFDGRVLSGSVDVGQVVQPGRALFTIYARDLLEVPLPLDDEELAFFDWQGPKAAAAVVSARFGGSEHRWRGRVDRIGVVDARSRRVTVFIVVEAMAAEEDVELRPGTFVHVAIAGRHLEDVVEVPPHLVHEGDILYVARNATLTLLPVDVLRRTRKAVYLRGAFQPGDMIIRTSLETATEGMPLRIEGDHS